MDNIQNLKVRNMYSSKGNLVPNQFLIEANGGLYFQSYDSVIAFRQGHEVMLDEKYWDYSRTTGKYLSHFLGVNKAETQKRIDSGEYKLGNLN